MGLSDLNFLFRFLPVFLVLYILCPPKYRNGILFAASLLFCALSSREGVLVLLCSLTVNYILIRLMDFESQYPRRRQAGHSSGSSEMSRDTGTWTAAARSSTAGSPKMRRDTNTRAATAHSSASSPEIPRDIGSRGAHPADNRTRVCSSGRFKMLSWRRAWLCLTILFNVGLLLFYKYAAGTLPPGISFYTFTLLSADIDIYLRRESAPQSWLELGAYIAMFPKLLSGPITEYHSVIGQMRSRETSGKKVEYGLSLMIIGLSFKVLIADTLGILWHDIQTVGFESISTPLAWMGMAAYSVQLLFDFQGYSLMAVGLGHMLGFDLPQNFNHPYRSRSVSEYYRRWHISLGRWFRDYLYIPLGGSRTGTARTVLNLFIVWIVTGIWHGVTLNFLLWGLILGTFIVLEKLFLGNFLGNHRLLSHLYIWLLLPLTWIIFAITDLSSLGIYFTRLFPFWGGGIAVNGKDWLLHGRNYLGFFLAALAVSCPLADSLWKKYWNTLPAKGALLALFWVCVYRIVNGLHNPFMYLGF